MGQIYDVLKAHWKKVGGATETKNSPHTLLSLDPALLTCLCFFLMYAQQFGLVLLGDKGTGRP